MENMTASHQNLWKISQKPIEIDRDLPMPKFDVSAYKMYNLIACLFDPKYERMRFLNHGQKGYQIIPTLVFAEIDELRNENKGIVTMSDAQFGNDKNFSFLQKLNVKYPYKLAIRLEDHLAHIDDANKLLKYAEYKLNAYFNLIRERGNTSFDLEPCFNDIARELLARGGSGFTTGSEHDGYTMMPSKQQKAMSMSISTNMQRPVINYTQMKSFSIEYN